MTQKDYAEGFTRRRQEWLQGLPKYLSAISLFWEYNVGYKVLFVGFDTLFGQRFIAKKYQGRRPVGYFGELALPEITPSLIIPRFSRVLKRFRGHWLGQQLVREVGAKLPVVNPEAKEVFFGIPEDTRLEMRSHAMSIAGPEGYLNDPYAVAYMVKWMLEREVPIKNPELIGLVMLEMAGRKL